MVMIEIRLILCPVDFSDFSRRSVDHSMAIARWYGASVTALHVYPLPTVAAAPTGPIIMEPTLLTVSGREQLLAAARRLLDVERAPGIQTDAVIREGTVAAEILAQADSMQADLVVIGTHGRSGVDRWLLGSVAEKVLRKSRCPVLTVPPGLPDAVPAAPVLFKRIVCPVDFSDSSMRALEYARSLAGEADAELTVTHVVTPGFEIPFDYPVGETSLTLAEAQKLYEMDAKRRLDTVTSGDTEACTVRPLLTRGKPWKEILRIVAQVQADLVVMGVQGRSAADLMFFGSTTQHVVRQATCPVLTIKAQ
jgi:nucleotide-binding universal stress UspA family protein